MSQCTFGSTTCKCAGCSCNASNDGCNHGYCIHCFECEDKQKAVHNVYLCTGFEPMDNESKKTLDE